MLQHHPPAEATSQSLAAHSRGTRARKTYRDELATRSARLWHLPQSLRIKIVSQPDPKSDHDSAGVGGRAYPGNLRNGSIDQPRSPRASIVSVQADDGRPRVPDKVVAEPQIAHAGDEIGPLIADRRDGASSTRGDQCRWTRIGYPLRSRSRCAPSRSRAPGFHPEGPRTGSSLCGDGTGITPCADDACGARRGRAGTMWLLRWRPRDDILYRAEFRSLRDPIPKCR
jgi:hypothetical protein